MTEGRKGEARNRVEVALGTLSEAKPVEGVWSRHHAVDQKRAVIAFDDTGLFAFDLRQLAGDGLEQIGLRHDPLKHAIFVENSRESYRRLLELLEHPEDRHGFWDCDRLAQR